MHLNVACVTNIWRNEYLCDTNLCDHHLTCIIRINIKLAQKMSLYGNVYLAVSIFQGVDPGGGHGGQMTPLPGLNMLYQLAVLG